MAAIVNKYCYEWLLMMSAGMATHISQLCVSGICFKQEAPQPDAPSILFCFALCVLICNFNWWPASLRRRPKYILNTYKVIVTCVVVDFVMRTIYSSYQEGLKWSLEYPCREIKTQNADIDDLLKKLAEPDSVLLISTLMSASLIGIVTYVTGRTEDLKCLFKTVLRKFGKKD